jgi:hypothetical protein
LERDGYETAFTTVDLKSQRRSIRTTVPVIYLKRPKEQNLDEVTVTATKVKFYYKGDTIVYNADAFQTADGSTLDALIKQLPGAELKSDGRIYVNGKFVQSLILNGRDFFKGNNKVMLENLPTYAVDKIKVYEKLGTLSKFVGKDMDDKEFVMDVNLKKQYNIGWMGNVDAGAATQGMYLARLFAMRSTDHSRIAFYGNCNDINDSSTPIKDTDWTPEMMPKGRLTTKKAGVNLNIYDRLDRFTLTSTADLTHYDNHVNSNTFRTNFLSSGDTYDRVVNKAKYCNFNLSEWNKLDLTPKNKDGKSTVNIRITQRGSYSRNKSTLEDLSATSKESLDGYGDGIVDSLSAPIISASLRQKLMNRTMNNTFSDTKSWSTSLETSIFYLFKNRSDALQFYSKGSLSGSEQDLFSQYRVDYFSGGSATTDFRNRYGDNTPGRGYNYMVLLRYYYSPMKNLSFKFTYDYEHKYTDREDKLYRLDNLDGWGTGTGHALGTLPSVSEYMSTLDAGNSFRGLLHEGKHVPYINIRWVPVNGKKNFVRIDAWLNANIYDQHLTYHRASVDTTFSRTKAFFFPEIKMFWSRKNDNGYQRVSFEYMPTYSLPDMTYSINMTDDSDPLNVTRYVNKNLKSIATHSFELSYDNSIKGIMLSPEISYSFTRNAVSMGYVYDTETGKKTYSPYNVNGNWNLKTGLSVSGMLDRKKLLDFNSSTEWNYISSADMIGTEIGAELGKSIVKTSWLNENLRLNYKLGKSGIGLKGVFSWICSTGDQEAFTTVNAS